MEHEIWKAKMQEFYDSELAAPEVPALEDHLRSCGECRRELERLKQASRIFFSEPGAAVPSDFVSSVMRRIPAEDRAAAGSLGAVWRELFGLPRWETVTALCVTLLVACYFAAHRLRSGEGNAEAAPAAWFYSQAGMESRLLLKEKTGQEELLKVALGNGEESEVEVEADE